MKTRKTPTQANPQQKNNSKIFNFFNSPVPIIIVLSLCIVGLLMYIKLNPNRGSLYSFGNSTEDITVSNGTIYIGRDINHFSNSKITFEGKDTKLYNFEIGYYIKNGDIYNPIVTLKTLEEINEEGASLKQIIENSDFSFTENHQDAKFLSEENVKNIVNLVFKIKGQDKKGDEISIEVPLEVNEITN